MEKLCKSDGTKLIYSSFALKCIFEILEHFLFARLNFDSTTFWKQIFLVTFYLIVLLITLWDCILHF